MAIRLKRAYDKPADNDGYRVLVDRIWPRGVNRKEARLDEWLKDIAPSAGLRKWFGHDVERWEEFKTRYHRELADKRELVERLVAIEKNGRLTLVFGARDRKRNNAVALKQFLQNSADPEKGWNNFHPLDDLPGE